MIHKNSAADVVITCFPNMHAVYFKTKRYSFYGPGCGRQPMCQCIHMVAYCINPQGCHLMDDPHIPINQFGESVVSKVHRVSRDVGDGSNVVLNKVCQYLIECNARRSRFMYLPRTRRCVHLLPDWCVPSRRRLQQWLAECSATDGSLSLVDGCKVGGSVDASIKVVKCAPLAHCPRPARFHSRETVTPVNDHQLCPTAKLHAPPIYPGQVAACSAFARCFASDTI